MCELARSPYSSARFASSPSSIAGKTSLLLRFLILAAVCGIWTPHLPAQTPTPVTVPTWRYDLTHAGQNTNETLLTPANVNGSGFGKLFSQTVDGSVYAQPLYVNGLTMSDGQVHNVLFVAT